MIIFVGSIPTIKAESCKKPRVDDGSAEPARESPHAAPMDTLSKTYTCLVTIHFKFV